MADFFSLSQDYSDSVSVALTHLEKLGITCENDINDQILENFKMGVYAIDDLCNGLIGNAIADCVFSNLSEFIQDFFNLESNYYVNSLDSHFYVDGDDVLYYENLDEFLGDLCKKAVSDDVGKCRLAELIQIDDNWLDGVMYQTFDKMVCAVRNNRNRLKNSKGLLAIFENAKDDINERLNAILKEKGLDDCLEFDDLRVCCKLDVPFDIAWDLDNAFFDLLEQNDFTQIRKMATTLKEIA